MTIDLMLAILLAVAAVAFGIALGNFLGLPASIIVAYVVFASTPLTLIWVFYGMEKVVKFGPKVLIAALLACPFVYFGWRRGRKDCAHRTQN